MEIKLKEIQSSNIYIIENAFDNDLCDKLINYIDISNT